MWRFSSIHPLGSVRIHIPPGIPIRFPVVSSSFYAVLPFADADPLYNKGPGRNYVPQSAVGNLIRVPLTRQSSDYTCGVAVLQSILYFHDAHDDYFEDTLVKELKTDPVNGTSYKAMADFARSKGYLVDARTEMALDDIRNTVDNGVAGHRSLIQAWAESPVDYSQDWQDGHYAVAIGYDRDTVYLWTHQPWEITRIFRTRNFWDRWHDEDKGVKLNHFGLIIQRENRKNHYAPDNISRFDRSDLPLKPLQFHRGFPRQQRSNKTPFTPRNGSCLHGVCGPCGFPSRIR